MADTNRLWIYKMSGGRLLHLKTDGGAQALCGATPPATPQNQRDPLNGWVKIMDQKSLLTCSGCAAARDARKAATAGAQGAGR